jgi:hypothetical protein
MDRHVTIHGQELKLYRVAGFENAWCSDRALALQIQRKRQQFLEELNSDAEELRAVAVKSDWID